jgi:hypothetical protein
VEEVALPVLEVDEVLELALPVFEVADVLEAEEVLDDVAEVAAVVPEELLAVAMVVPEDPLLVELLEDDAEVLADAVDPEELLEELPPMHVPRRQVAPVETPAAVKTSWAMLLPQLAMTIHTWLSGFGVNPAYAGLISAL